MQIYKTFFGQKLRAARKGKELSQEKLADALSVEPPSISRWENGHDFPDDSRLALICSELGVPIEYFEGKDDLLRPSNGSLKALISSPAEGVPLLSLIPVLKRFLNEAPEVRALVLAILYGDQTIADLASEGGKGGSR